MERSIVLPQLSQKSEKGILTAWFKDVGEEVKAGEVLYEVETEKAVHQIESVFTGTISEIYKEEGDSLMYGEELAKLNEVNV